MILKSLFLYPVKSLAGNNLLQAEIFPEGMKNDRRWLITDLNGRFLTARQLPILLLWQARIDKDKQLILTTPNGEQKNISPHQCKKEEQVTVWRDQFSAFLAPEEINHWLSTHLGLPCLLFYLGKRSQRSLKNYQTGLTFADSAPYLLTTTSSLQALNYHLKSPVEINRFRPNFVIEGDLQPWVEESWQNYITIGEVKFKFLKFCTRCKMVNIDLITGQPSDNHQPLKTLQVLQRERLSGNDPVFGIHLIAQNHGTLTVGDEVIID